MKRLICTGITGLIIITTTSSSLAYRTYAPSAYRPTNYYRHTSSAYTPQQTTNKTGYATNNYRYTTKKPATEQPSDKFISACRLGFDLMGGTVSSPKTIKYGITDFYTQEKTSEYSFNHAVAGVGFNFGLQHYQEFESELFLDLYSGGTRSAPAYYNYISYPMTVTGYLIPFGLREHYYHSLSEKFKLDIALGIGGIYTSGFYSDKYDIEAYRQEPWQDTVFMYEGTIGFVYYPWEFLPLRFGYRRSNFSSDYIGTGINTFYFGVSYLFD